jgi:flagellar motility protein MotE (MotC chaperone)
MNLPSLKRSTAPIRRGSVAVIVLLLFSSASIRVLTSGGEAFAQSGQLPTTPVAAALKPSELQPNSKPEEEKSTSSLGSAKLINREEVSALITALTEREAQVVEREKQIEMRLRALSVADSEIEKRLLALTEMEQNLRATLSLADEASEKDILGLTAVYESMKPKDAAALFEQMEPNFAAGFLGRMRPDVAASVMAGLSPQVAYSISVVLAGRNANAPKS